MANTRVSRHHIRDIRCPDCGSNRMRQDGFSNGKPAYSGAVATAARVLSGDDMPDCRRRIAATRYAGKGAAVNWNAGLHSALRSKLNRLMLAHSLAPVCGRQ